MQKSSSPTGRVAPEQGLQLLLLLLCGLNFGSRRGRLPGRRTLGKGGVVDQSDSDTYFPEDLAAGFYPALHRKTSVAFYDPHASG